MSSDGKKQLQASTLRLMLFGIMGLIVAVSAGGFVFGVGFVRSYAAQISSVRSQADASNNNVQKLQDTKKQLEKNSDVTAKIEKLRANAKSNDNYPEIEIINSIRAIASNNNLGVQDISGGGSTAGTSGSAPTSNGQASTPQASGAPAGAAAKPTAADTVSVTVSLTSPANYEDYVQFLYDIEQSLPIMKIDGINISPPSEGASDQINPGSLTIHMYIKKG